MNITSRQLARALYQSLLDTPDKEGEVVQEFIKYLEEKNLIGLLPSVVKNLEYLQARIEAQDNIKLTVNQQLPAELVKKIKNFVGQTNADIEIVKDSNILGGFIAEYQNKIYDSSVSGQLNQVKKNLLNSKNNSKNN